MTSVSSLAAKSHLPRLLARVAQGERIVITNRGKPVAMLAPPESEGPASTVEIGRAMLAYRDQVQRELGGSFRELAHEGNAVRHFCAGNALFFVVFGTR